MKTLGLKTGTDISDTLLRLVCSRGPRGGSFGWRRRPQNPQKEANLFRRLGCCRKKTCLFLSDRRTVGLFDCLTVGLGAHPVLAPHGAHAVERASLLHGHHLHQGGHDLAHGGVLQLQHACDHLALLGLHRAGLHRAAAGGGQEGVRRGSGSSPR
eukprot:9467743-Pyramimonas_sp.AAC.1